MQDYIVERVREIAEYILSTKATVRSAAKEFMVSKSTVHTDMSVRLAELDNDLYLKVREVLDYNFSVRHLRGGESTCKKYKKYKDK